MSIHVPRDAMRTVLSAMIFDRGALELGLAALRPDAMPGHEGYVLRAMREMHAAGKAVEMLTLADHLRTTGNLVVAGGPAAIAEICEYTGSTANFEAHCAIVNASAARTALRLVCHKINTEIDGLDATEEVIDRAERALLGVRDAYPKRVTIEPLHRILDRVVQQPRRGTDTGFVRLDNCTGGLHDGQLVVIAARPGVGKTAFVTCLARNIAQRGRPVLFLSLEMDEQEIGERLIALHGPPLERVRAGGEEVARATVRAAQLPLSIVHIPDPTIIDLRAAIRRLGAKPAAVIVDYLQLARTGEKFQRRFEEVDRVALLLKRMAVENQVPVIAAAQLNRASEDRGKMRRPVLSDLRESGGIEIHANVVAFIHRPKYYESSNTEAELIVAKNRHGPLSHGPLVFHGASVSFENPAMPPEPQGTAELF